MEAEQQFSQTRINNTPKQKSPQGKANKKSRNQVSPSGNSNQQNTSASKISAKEVFIQIIYGSNQNLLKQNIQEIIRQLIKNNGTEILQIQKNTDILQILWNVVESNLKLDPNSHNLIRDTYKILSKQDKKYWPKVKNKGKNLILQPLRNKSSFIKEIYGKLLKAFKEFLDKRVSKKKIKMEALKKKMLAFLNLLFLFRSQRELNFSKIKGLRILKNFGMPPPPCFGI